MTTKEILLNNVLHAFLSQHADLYKDYEDKEKSTRRFGGAFLELAVKLGNMDRDDLLTLFGPPDYTGDYKRGETLFYVNVVDRYVSALVVSNGKFSMLSTMTWDEFLKTKPHLTVWGLPETEKIENSQSPGAEEQDQNR